MKYEKINKNYTKTIIISFIVIIIIGSVLVLNITKAKYKTTVSVPIVSGTIKYSGGYDFKIMALYKQNEEKNCTDDECYDEIGQMPSGDYEINTSKSYCTLDGENKEYDKLATINGIHSIKNLKKNEKCYLYFDKEVKVGDTIVANSSVIDEAPTFSKTSCLQGCEVSENGLYKTEDDFGDSYYFRGTVENNWVKFGQDKSNNDIYWRIIRINGDGTIRLIYAGVTKDNGDPPDLTGSQTNALTGQKFNSSYNDNMYVGYQFESGDKRGIKSPSNAYTQLMSWFGENLIEEWNSGNGQIDPSAGFCGDRSSLTSQSSWKEDMQESGGTGNAVVTYYGSRLRLENSNKQPTLKCSTTSHKNNDYYTFEKSTGIESTINGKIYSGTQSLEYPIGLITADEVAFAGAVSGKANSGYWLNTGENYWTMSPYGFGSSDGAYVYRVNSSGSIYNYTVNHAIGLRPVINLKSDTEFTFEHPDQADKGTSTNPYIVS